jgi:hypothetical protein
VDVHRGGWPRAKRLAKSKRLNHTVACPECVRLLAESERLERCYVAAFGTMVDSSAAPAAEFTKLRIAADLARIDSEVVRQKLERHRCIHSGVN